MGKDRGDDFREGKMTMPVIFAYARGSDEERRFWQDAVAGFRTEEEDFARAVGLIRRHGAISATRERARHFAQRACDALAIFPDGKARAAMIEAAQFAVSRGY
jgi:octaprenyl-diphosphate synthase